MLLLIFLIVLTGVFSVMVHVIDRSSNWQSDIYAMTLWTAFVQLLLILPFVGLVTIIPLGIAGVLFGVALLTAYTRSRWYLALATSGDHLSRLLPLTHASSFLVLIFAVVFLGEDLPPLAAAGGSAMVLGAVFITMEQPAATFKEFLAANFVLVLVLGVALARAVNNISYKWIFDHGDFDFFTVYFYLKVFEFLASAAIVMSSSGMRANFHRISNPQAFVAARGLQTLSGLIFIFVLNNMDISKAEPIAAAGPIYALLWEWLDRRYGLVARLGGRPAPQKRLSRLAWTMRLLGIACIIGGFVMLQKGIG